MTKGIYIGIDPGADTGVCIWDADLQEILFLQTLSFWEVIGMLSKYRQEQRNHLTVIVEDPNLNKGIHWHQKKSVDGFNPATKVAQNIGMNKKEAELILRYLQINKFKYKAVRPTARKIKADYSSRLSGYKERTNQHERDAAMLVIGY